MLSTAAKYAARCCRKAPGATEDFVMRAASSKEKRLTAFAICGARALTAKIRPLCGIAAFAGKALPAGSSPNRRYCLTCGEKVHLELARERARRVRAEKPKDKKPAPPPKPAPKEKLPRGEHRKVDKPCKECGTMMYGVDPGKMFCDACKKRRYGKGGADTGVQPGIVKPKEKPKTNHDLLVDDNAAAAAKGMSYGHFKEWQRRQKELKERGEI